MSEPNAQEQARYEALMEAILKNLRPLLDGMRVEHKASLNGRVSPYHVTLDDVAIVASAAAVMAIEAARVERGQ